MIWDVARNTFLGLCMIVGVPMVVIGVPLMLGWVR